MMKNLTLFMSIMLFLSLPLFVPTKKKSKSSMTLFCVSALMSSTFVMIWALSDFPTLVINLFWLKSPLQEFKASFLIDPAFMLFSAVAFYVTWSIIEFSHYYMSNDPKKKAFMNTLILFLLFMLMLMSAKSLFILFIGWEGVGIMSFILMGWWFTRSDAKSAAMQAIMYKRMGDSGMMLFMGFSMLFLKTWKLKEIMMLNHKSPISYWPILGIILAATGKSAQFGLHPWLPAAMEGPTPVSALLHSSTMVVAGIFLLYRCSKIFKENSWSLPLMGLLGSMTALFAASSALTQFDMKKVVAYSTTSQLGMMAVAMGLNIPELALFHMCTHAFFKALLFLCSGSIIHSLKKEQDLRKMSKSSYFLPFTTSCLIMGSLALAGLPFLAGFYSKDLMLETGQFSMTKSMTVMIALMATLMTALYSFRTIYLCKTPLTNKKVLNPISEEKMKLNIPLTRLILGVFMSGWSLSLSYFFFKLPIVSLFTKSLPLMTVMLAATYLFMMHQPNMNKKNLMAIPNFLAQKWYYVKILHGPLFKTSLLNSMKGVLRLLDQGWTSRMGPQGTTQTFTFLTSTFQSPQSGMMSYYLSYSFLLILLLSCYLLTK